MAGWVGRVGWLIVVTRPAISLAQDRESSPAVTGVFTTMLRHQLRDQDPVCHTRAPC